MDRMIFRHLLAAACGLGLAGPVVAQQVGQYPVGAWNPGVPGAGLGAFPGAGIGNSPLGPVGPWGGNPNAAAGYPGSNPGFDGTYGAFNTPQPGLPDDSSLYNPPAWTPMPQYRTVPARAPQSLKEYRPSIPGGVDAKRFSAGPGGSIRDLPYLRKGGSSAQFVTPPGMEMPDHVSGNTGPKTWRDRLRRVMFPLGDPLGVLK